MKGTPVSVLKSGQVSVEYLVIVGIALGLLIPGVLFFYVYSQSNVGSTTSSRINDAGLQMISTANNAYAQGTGAWQTLEFIMPESVTRVYTNDTELVFVYETQDGTSHAVFFSPVTLVTSLPDGNISKEPHPGATRYRFTTTNNQQIKITEPAT